MPCNGAGPYHRCHGLPVDWSNAAGAYNQACTGEAHEAEFLPSDFFILLDRSASMQLDLPGNPPGSPSFGESRWDGVRAGLQPVVEGGVLWYAGMALHAFGYDASRSEELNCDPASYFQPVVPTGQLPEVGPDILAAVEELTPQLGGPAPTLPALQGVIPYASQWATEDHRAPRLVLVTGSLPTQCQETNSVEQLAAEAARGLVEAGVLTYVVGVGQRLDDLHAVADAGGTCEAFLIEEGEIGPQLSEALRLIPFHFISPLGCELEIHEPLDPTQAIDPERTLVVYTPPNGPPEMIPPLESLDLCPQSPHGGWAYDSNVNPDMVVLCPCTCNSLSAGRLEVLYYCEPRVFD